MTDCLLGLCSYWLKFGQGALRYFMAPEVLVAVWGPGGAAWKK